MANTKHIEHNAPWLSSHFNTKTSIEWGANGRLRGLEAVPNAANTFVTPNLGAFILGGIVVKIDTAVAAVPVSGPLPRCLTAFTPDDDNSSAITFTVEFYDPVSLAGKAILSVNASGNEWVSTTPLGIKEIADLATTKQLSEEELRLLTAQDGNIDAADTLHTHRGVIRDKVVFETLTGLDFDKLPHVPKGRPPVSADQLHTHNNIPTDAQFDAVFGRGGVQSADEEHTHDNLPTDEAFAATFSGPEVSASAWHTHDYHAHGNVIAQRPIIWYAPQNTGTGIAYIDATAGTFTGSLALILGSSITGGSIDRIVGIRYKEFTRFLYQNQTAAIGTNQVVGQPVTEVTELFAPGNPSGVVSKVPFNQEFTWRGIRFLIEVPTIGARPFVPPSVTDSTGDFFTFHGVVATTTTIPGFPGCPVGDQIGGAIGKTKMHERLLSFLPLRLVPVPDERFPEGGYFTLPYI